MLSRYVKVCFDLHDTVFELRCGVQEYDWGKIGHDSEVAVLKASADPEFRINPAKKYAEVSDIQEEFIKWCDIN